MTRSDPMARLRARLVECLALKDRPRRGWLRAGIERPESVAAHSWGVAWLVLVLAPTDLDRRRAIELAVVHDLGEAHTGDVTPADGVPPAAKLAAERAAVRALAEPLSRPDEVVALWEEYAAGATPEARFVRACDKLDMALQAMRYRPSATGSVAEFVASAVGAIGDGELRELARGC